jgi:DNA-binding MurR/RpiR family transcriptional regulator
MTAFSWSSSDGQSRLQEAVSAQLPHLTPAEARVAQYLVHHESDIVFETGASIARKAGVSEITVSRLLRRLGFQGVAGLKQALKEDQAAELLDSGALSDRLFSGDYGDALRKEAQALLALSEQIRDPSWGILVEKTYSSEAVYTTGFQTVRGAAEDFARRLALVRSNVRFLAAHDGALAEWISPAGNASRGGILILIDVVPYAREARALAELCDRQGLELAVFTDEFNTWARGYTEMIIHVQTRSGLFLESTGTLTTALNLLVHGVALRDPDATSERIGSWRDLVSSIDLF